VLLFDVVNMMLTFMSVLLRCRWYQAESNTVWGSDKPSLEETHSHAKCLRSVTSSKDETKAHRKKKHVSSSMPGHTCRHHPHDDAR
jgi:hypothetical protein